MCTCPTHQARHSLTTTLARIDTNVINSAASSGRSRGGARAPIFMVNKEEMAEGRKAGWASKVKLAPSLAQSLDLPLASYAAEMKAKFPQCEQIRLNEHVLKPGIPE